MAEHHLEAGIREIGLRFFEAIQDEQPSLFNMEWWTGEVLNWAMRHEHFKVRLFRFVDVLPSLTTKESLVRHLEEYFGEEDEDTPPLLRWGAKHAGLGGSLTAGLLGASLRKNIETMARQFMAGRDAEEALTKLADLREHGFAATLDVLGEAAVSDSEARTYQAKYLEVLDQLDRQSRSWPPFGAEGGDLDWGHAPRANLSVKATTLFSRTSPMAFDHAVATVTERFRPLLARAREIGAFINIDMEQHPYKDITIAVYKRLRAMEEFRDFPHLGLVLQAYRKDTPDDLDGLLQWARDEKLPIAIRLVKGAYWDYEVVTARQKNLDCPVYAEKWQTDVAFERLSRTILKNRDICYFACGTHNIRTIAAVMAMAEELRVPPSRYEFQLLYGMAEPVRKATGRLAGRVRLYCPFGELLPGMGYLVRRLLENTANESFLRQSFAEKVDPEVLLRDPEERRPAPTSTPPPTGKPAAARPATAAPAPLPFANQPAADFTVASLREAFPEAIGQWRANLGRTYPLLINGEEVFNDTLHHSVNPARPREIVGTVCQAGPEEIDRAIRAARESLESWRLTPADQRAGHLFKTAELLRRDIVSLAALQVLEVGKQWDQAHADVTEAIDFLEYYGREMIRLGQGRPMLNPPGEENRYTYEPKGIAAVIAPWNFPLAISCGMCAAALVAGNGVLYKPSNLSPVTGARLARLFLEAGVPAGVLHFVPGSGGRMGDYLVEHPEINLIAFTGSMEVGTRILEKAARVGPGQDHVKKAVIEMGGKNAIIIDDDADLDQAVPEVLASAFGYQGQKCSACSRVIVLAEIYEKFRQRLLEAADSLTLGPVEEPRHDLGPVVSGEARDKIRRYIDLARTEATILLERPAPAGEGYYVPLVILEGLTPDHRLAREEIFGPVLVLMRAEDFSQAIRLANGTRFALTGGVFSRSPKNLEYARRHFRVGNLYFNRSITGALVGRQPFGGFGLSGIGSKAGGPDYLPQFLDPVSVTENTMRRGFAPLNDR